MAHSPVTAPASSSAPSPAERFFFENNGYLVIENLLAPDHVARLRAALDRAIARRRAAIPPDWKWTWPPACQADLTQINGATSTRILNILEDDPLFLELLTWPALMPYVRALFNPAPHYHASDAIVEHGGDFMNRPVGWHIDGSDNGYRALAAPIPLLQLKIGWYLSDMSQPWRGNLTFVPGSHKARIDPAPDDLKRREFFPGARQICAPAGTLVLFHNAIWHTAAAYREPADGRALLYYAFEHPWMLASTAHWNYSREFYNHRLTPAQRQLFHGFVFDPPELR